MARLRVVAYFVAPRDSFRFRTRVKYREQHLEPAQQLQHLVGKYPLAIA